MDFMQRWYIMTKVNKLMRKSFFKDFHLMSKLKSVFDDEVKIM